MKNPSKHSLETIERMRANGEAARKRLDRLNEEYQLRQQAQKVCRLKVTRKRETFGEAVARIAKQDRVAL